MKDIVIIVGGGAAGLFASCIASENSKVILIEKTDKLGKKLLISGKGRCNLTNSQELDEIMKQIPGNGRFLHSSFCQFSNIDIINFFEKNGLKTKIERGFRVFPESDNAYDVVKCMTNILYKRNVEILLNTPVDSLLVEDEKVIGVKLKNSNKIMANKVILCTGGLSYPGTGSTGDGYKISTKVGHTITKIMPSLVPLVSNEDWIKELQGLSLKNVKIKLFKENKKIYEDFGEMLFTHFGVSGPIVLSASRHFEDDNKNYTLSIDLKPALSVEKLTERVKRDFLNNSRKQFKNSLDELLPQKLIPVFIKLTKISPEKNINQITKEERDIVVNFLKNLNLNITSTRSINEAIITRGGISIKQINPKTLESKIIKGLYFAGELIDVDAYTGGYNLTIAFSTAFVAATN